MKTKPSYNAYGRSVVYQSENYGGRYEYRSNEHENWTVKPHIHAYSEIAYTISGVSTVVVDGERYRVGKDELIYIMPNQVHQYDPKTPSVLRCAVFSSDHVPFFFEKMQGKRPLNPVVDFSADPTLLRLLQSTPPTDTLKISGYLNLICNRLLSSVAVPNPGYGSNIFREVIDFVQQHYRESITLKQVASAVGYSEKYLSKILHSVTRTNFRTFLNSFRIDEAVRLLRSAKENGRTIAQIAADCGFDSLVTFNRIFRLFTNKTPSSFV